jgi:hypothetical protein
VAERAPEPGEVFSFAARKARFYAALGPLLVGGVLIGVLVVGAPNPWRLLAVPAAIALGLVLRRAANVALELRYDGVVVRNTYRTYELRWGNIRFVYLGDGVGWGNCVAFAVKDARLGIEADATSDAWPNEELRHQLRRYAEPHGVQFARELLER